MQIQEGRGLRAGCRFSRGGWLLGAVSSSRGEDPPALPLQLHPAHKEAARRPARRRAQPSRRGHPRGGQHHASCPQVRRGGPESGAVSEDAEGPLGLRAQQTLAHIHVHRCLSLPSSD